MKKREVVYAPMTVCPNCGGMRCTIMRAVREHPDFDNGTVIISTMVGIVAELLSALPPDKDAESAEGVKATFVMALADLRAMPAGEGERVH